MPLHCTIRENRTKPRFWTARKAAEVACNAIRHGANPQEIHALIVACSHSGPRDKTAEALQALQIAENAISIDQAFFDADAQFIERFLFVTQVLSVATRVLRLIPIPAVRNSALLVVALRTIASDQLKAITVRKAANDAALTIIRRAAANEARFLRTGTGL